MYLAVYCQPIPPMIRISFPNTDFMSTIGQNELSEQRQTSLHTRRAQIFIGETENKQIITVQCDTATNQGILSATRRWKSDRLSPRASRGSMALLIPQFWPRNTGFRLLAPRSVREHTSVVLSYQVCSHLLQLELYCFIINLGEPLVRTPFSVQLQVRISQNEVKRDLGGRSMAAALMP